MSTIDDRTAAVAGLVPDLATRTFAALGLALQAGPASDGSDPAVALSPEGDGVAVTANLVGADGRVAARLVVAGAGAAGAALAGAAAGEPAESLLDAVTAALADTPAPLGGLLVDRAALTTPATALDGLVRATDPSPVAVPLLDGGTHVATVAVAWTGPAAADLPPLPPTAEGGGALRPLSSLGEVQLAVSVELGRTDLTLRELLGLHPGAVVELDRSIHEPVEVFANGTMIAKGEMVLVDDAYGVRITELVEGDER